MKSQDRRLIDVYLPIMEIGNASKKSVELHRWWARRPLVACLCAAYASLINEPETKSNLESVSRFVKSLCKHSLNVDQVNRAIRDIYEAHAERLSGQFGQ